MTVLQVRACGPMTSPQDQGRVGQGRHGLSRSGAMDRDALATANAAVGNAADVAALEFMLLGGSFEVAGGGARIAVAGAPCAVSAGGRSIDHLTATDLGPGDTLVLGHVNAGVFAYLAVAGGFALAPDLGSVSFHPRAGIGGFGGRALRAGDALPLRTGTVSGGGDTTLDLVRNEESGPIRVVLGPQDDHFAADAVAAFLATTYTVSDEADRMGYRLAGPPIEHARGYNIVSDGLIAGSVQVPGSGVPIVMMADHQTTGGYPKIATVISADLGRLAQCRPGTPVTFAALDVATAIDIARRRAAWIAGLPGRLRPAASRMPDAESLLGLNLAGDATDAFAEPGAGRSFGSR